MLKSAEVEAADNKKEYDTILVEMRDPDFKAIYGADKVNCVLNSKSNFRI